jgi:mRNA interferase YafQ
MDRRGKDLRKLHVLMLLLAQEAILDPSYRDHALKGEWTGSRDAHVEPDWILIYRLEDSDAIYFERTGSHADLFRS